MPNNCVRPQRFIAMIKLMLRNTHSERKKCSIKRKVIVIFSLNYTLSRLSTTMVYTNDAYNFVIADITAKFNKKLVPSTIIYTNCLFKRLQVLNLFFSQCKRNFFVNFKAL